MLLLREDKFVEEAEFITQIKRASLPWRYWFAKAACFAFVLSIAKLIPNIVDTLKTPFDFESTIESESENYDNPNNLVTGQDYSVEEPMIEGAMMPPIILLQNKIIV